MCASIPIPLRKVRIHRFGFSPHADDADADGGTALISLCPGHANALAVLAPSTTVRTTDWSIYFASLHPGW